MTHLKTKYVLLAAIACIASHPVLASPMSDFFKSSCVFNPDVQRDRSKELEALAKADQSDRKNPLTSEAALLKMTINDLSRRKRVGEIFGEGCFKTASDYMSGAIIYQHGNIPEHNYQAFIWARKAVELGDNAGKHFSALAIDRYLVATGRKQLFGSQFLMKGLTACPCMEPVEMSFPDAKRKLYSGQTLDESYQHMVKEIGKQCPKVECDTPLKPTPRGSVEGFW